MKAKVLLIRFNSIGDIVLTSPVIKTLSNSGYELHYLVKKAYKSLLVNNPYVDKIWSYDGNLSSLIAELKKEQFDYIIDLHNTFRSAIIRVRLNRPSFTFKKYRFKNWLMTNFGFYKFQRRHIVDRFLDLIKTLHLKETNSELEYYFPDNDFFDNISIPYHNFIVLAIGTAFKTKNIPFDKLRDLINRLDYPILLIGSDTDLDISQKLTNSCDNDRLLSYVGKLNLDESSYLISMSKLLVTGDTGMMHIAAALGIPTVSVFGSTHPILGYTPYYGSKKISYHIVQNEELSCRPCTKQGRKNCPKGHFKCMNSISVDEMRTKVESLLNS